MERAGQGCLLNGVGTKCCLTELVFCVEYFEFKGQDLSHQVFCHGGEQKDSPSSLTYCCVESMKRKAGCEDGGQY